MNLPQELHDDMRRKDHKPLLDSCRICFVALPCLKTISVMVLSRPRRFPPQSAILMTKPEYPRLLLHGRNCRIFHLRLKRDKANLTCRASKREDLKAQTHPILGNCLIPLKTEDGQERNLEASTTRRHHALSPGFHRKIF